MLGVRASETSELGGKRTQGGGGSVPDPEPSYRRVPVAANGTNATHARSTTHSPARTTARAGWRTEGADASTGRGGCQGARAGAPVLYPAGSRGGGQPLTRRRGMASKARAGADACRAGSGAR